METGVWTLDGRWCSREPTGHVLECVGTIDRPDRGIWKRTVVTGERNAHERHCRRGQPEMRPAHGETPGIGVFRTPSRGGVFESETLLARHPCPPPFRGRRASFAPAAKETRGGSLSCACDPNCNRRQQAQRAVQHRAQVAGCGEKEARQHAARRGPTTVSIEDSTFGV